MTELILARHGETEWNRTEVFRGRADIDLDQKGIKQAEALARHLKNTVLEAVYSSPIRRAMRTAGIVAESQGIEVTISPGLIDFDYGEWQGMTHDAVKHSPVYAESYHQWTGHPETTRIPGGERLDDVRTRAMAAVTGILNKHAGTVLLVSHRVVNKVLICAMLGLDNSHFWNIIQDTGAITVFSYRDGCFVLTRHNDTCFLMMPSATSSTDF